MNMENRKLKKKDIHETNKKTSSQKNDSGRWSDIWMYTDGLNIK